MTFRNIVVAALAVGILSGLAYSLYQQVALSPIIHAAESYEPAAADAPDPAHDGHPDDGARRILNTLAANVLIAIGFALVLLSAMALHNLKSEKPRVNWNSGILWGMGLMACFFIAPTLIGLHPEVPGTVAERLDQRQFWWVACAAATAAGLLLIYYGAAALRLAGGLLLVLPHLVAPPLSPLGYSTTDPAAVTALNELTQRFLVMTSIGMLIFFVILGALSGLASFRYIRYG